MIIQYFFLILLSSTIFNSSAMEQEKSYNIADYRERISFWTQVQQSLLAQENVAPFTPEENAWRKLISLENNNETWYEKAQILRDKKVQQEYEKSLSTEEQVFNKILEETSFSKRDEAWYTKAQSFVANIIKAQDLEIDKIKEQSTKQEKKQDQEKKSKNSSSCYFTTWNPALAITMAKIENSEQKRAEKQQLKRAPSPFHRFVSFTKKKAPQLSPKRRHSL